MLLRARLGVATASAAGLRPAYVQWRAQAADCAGEGAAATCERGIGLVLEAIDDYLVLDRATTGGRSVLDGVLL